MTFWLNALIRGVIDPWHVRYLRPPATHCNEQMQLSAWARLPELGSAWQPQDVSPWFVRLPSARGGPTIPTLLETIVAKRQQEPPTIVVVAFRFFAFTALTVQPSFAKPITPNARATQQPTYLRLAKLRQRAKCKEICPPNGVRRC